MDVKGLGHINVEKPVEDRRIESRKQIRSGTAADRDPNGHAQYESPKEENKEPLTEEQIMEAFERLKQMPAIKDSTLNAKLELVNARYFVVISDYSGKTVRRFPAQELSLLPVESDSQKGVLLNKAM